ALPGADRADLEQEALLGFWRALPCFDPARASLPTFSERVIANRIASTVRAQRAVRRTPVLTEAPSHSEHPGSAIELRLDVERALAVLHDNDRRLARLLADHSASEVSRILRKSGSTVLEGLRPIRIAFFEAGMAPASPRCKIPKSHIREKRRSLNSEFSGPRSAERDTSARIIAQATQPNGADGMFSWLHDTGSEYQNQVHKSCGRTGDNPNAGR